jgi:hypothetical protein
MYNIHVCRIWSIVKKRTYSKGEKYKMARSWYEYNFKEYNMLPESEYNGSHYADDVNQAYTIKEEIEMMFENKLIKRNRHHQLRWVNPKLDLYKYGEFIYLCEQGKLYWHDDVLWIDDPDEEYLNIEWDLDGF